MDSQRGNYKVAVEHRSSSGEAFYEVRIMNNDESQELFYGHLDTGDADEVQALCNGAADTMGVGNGIREGFVNRLQDYLLGRLSEPRQPIVEAVVAEEATPKSAELLSAEWGVYNQFPLESIPAAIRPLIMAGAHSYQCPPEFIAIPLLVGMGAAIGRTRQIQVKEGYLESTALWAMIVGDPGTAKSPAFKLATDPLMDFQNQEIWGIKSITCSSNEEPEITFEDAVVTSPRRIVVQDTTVEALAVIMGKNPKGLILARDEISGWIKGMDMYRGRQGSDVQFYLTAWSGGAHTVDRKNLEDPIKIRHTYLAVAGGIQPEVLRGLLDRERQQDGFSSRILISYPPGMKRQWIEEGIPEGLISPIYQIYEKLLRLDFEANNQPRILTWTSDAYDIFGQYMNHHMETIYRSNMDVSLQAAWTKLECYLARISLIIQMIRLAAGETAVSDRIEKSSVVAAISIVDYFKAQAVKFYQEVGINAVQNLQTRVLFWAERRSFSELTPRLLITYKFVRTAEEGWQLLDSMGQAGLGFWVQNDSKKKLFRLTPTQQVSNSANSPAGSKGGENIAQ